MNVKLYEIIENVRLSDIKSKYKEFSFPKKKK